MTRFIDVSQFSPTDWQRLVDYISILISIDRKNALQNKGDHHENS